MIDNLLKKTLAPQLQALIEKLDADDTSSYAVVKNFVRSYEKRLTRYERFVLNRALRKFGRTHLLNRAMEVVLNMNTQEEGSGAYQDVAKQRLYAGIQGTFEQEYAKRKFVEAPVKREGEYVNH